MLVSVFENNPYQENTIIVSDDSKECIIIDPGMYTASEQNAVTDFIKKQQLKPVFLLNTHCHIDHVFGNKFIADYYNLKPQYHKDEEVLLTAIPSYAPQRGLRYELSPLAETYLEEDQKITFGNIVLKIIFAPGHSPAHVCFYNDEDKILIGGDVLFRNSIGRTDLPGGNHDLLIKNIKEKLFSLPEETIVYPGHGPSTTIGFEKRTNPFF